MDPPATTTPPPVTEENHHSPSLSLPSSIKSEPDEDFTDVNQSTEKDQQTTQNPNSNQPATPTPSQAATPTPPSISYTELRNLSSALSSFQSCFSIIQQHIDNLKTAVDSCIITIPPHENTNIAILPHENTNIAVLPPASCSLQIVTTTTSAPIEETTKSEVKTSKDSSAELENLCKTMSGKGLKRYLVSNMSDISKLREQVPKALKLAQNPAKMVLECSGKFFLQGCKAYVNKDSPIVIGRVASVLALECLLLMGIEGVEIEKEVKDEAEQNALSWRKRIITEGGVSKAVEIDARGLLLLVGCFGVPKMFKIEDLRDLLRRSHIREISSALRKSTALVEKAPEIIEGMIKNKMEIGAVDLAYTFGLEDKFNAKTILTSFLQETLKEAAQSSVAPNEVNKKKLAALKSVIRCLEDHKVDPAKLLPEWNISEKISTLKNDLNEFDKKKKEEKTQKRKAEEESSKKLESAKKLIREVKRARQKGPGVQKQKGVAQVNNQRHLMNTSIPGHVNSYSASPSMLYASAAGTGQYGGVYGGGMMVDSAGHSAQTVGTGQYSPVYGGMIVDPAGRETNQAYGWRGDPALRERVVGHSYVGQPSSSSINGLYRTSTSSLEGYAMAPNASSVGVSNRRASDLYQFADAVIKNEYLPGGPTPHHSSYL